MHRPGSEDPHWHERKFAYSNSIPQKIRLWPPSADFNEYIFVNGTICLKEDNLNILGNGRQPYLVYVSISQRFLLFIFIVDNKVYQK